MHFTKTGVLVMLLLSYNNANAFDPFTAVSAGSSVLKGIGSIFGGIDEATSTASAIQDLYSEIDTEAKVSESGQKLINEVENIERLYAEMGYSTEDLLSSGDELSSARTLSETLRGITGVIRKAKSFKNVFGGMQKKAESAQIETKEIAREQLLVQYEILNQEKLAELRNVRKDLEEKVRKKRISKDLASELQKQGAKKIGKNGVLAFPKTDEVIEDGIKIAVKMRPYLLGLVLAVLFFRLIYNQFSFKSYEEYGDLIRDCFVCFLMMAVFPEIIRASFSISTNIASLIHSNNTPFFSREDAIKDFQLSMVPGGGDHSMWKTNVLAFLQFAWEGLRYACYSLASFLYKYIILVLVVLTPFVIFMSEMFNFSIGWKLFFLAFISLNLWPVLWNLFGVLVDLCTVHSSGYLKIFEVGISMILQVASPFMIYQISKMGTGSTTSLPSKSMETAGNAANNALAPMNTISTTLHDGATKITNLSFSTPENKQDYGSSSKYKNMEFELAKGRK